MTYSSPQLPSRCLVVAEAASVGVFCGHLLGPHILHDNMLGQSRALVQHTHTHRDTCNYESPWPDAKSLQESSSSSSFSDLSSVTDTVFGFYLCLFPLIFLIYHYPSDCHSLMMTTSISLAVCGYFLASFFVPSVATDHDLRVSLSLSISLCLFSLFDCHNKKKNTHNSCVGISGMNLLPMFSGEKPAIDSVHRN